MVADVATRPMIIAIVTHSESGLCADHSAVIIKLADFSEAMATSIHISAVLDSLFLLLQIIYVQCKPVHAPVRCRLVTAVMVAANHQSFYPVLPGVIVRADA